MSTALRWVVGVLAALVLIGLIAYARGTPHHHGIDVGQSSGAPGSVAAATSVA